MKDEELIQNFNTIAELSTEHWNHNNHYHSLIMEHFPKTNHNALDIGCGLGDFTRGMASYFKNVVGIDFSPTMISMARETSKEKTNIRYMEKNFMEMKDGEYKFDCIVSIACFHHLPLKESLRKMKSLLKEDGRIIILDLYKAHSIGDFITSLCAVPVHTFYSYKNKHSAKEKRFRAAWKEHNKFDNYATLQKIRSTSEVIFNHVTLKRLLFWRYMLILEK